METGQTIMGYWQRFRFASSPWFSGLQFPVYYLLSKDCPLIFGQDTGVAFLTYLYLLLIYFDYRATTSFFTQAHNLHSFHLLSVSYLNKLVI